MANDDATTQPEPETTPPPVEGGRGTAETDEGPQAARGRQEHAEGGASQEGRGRVQ